MSTFFGKIIYFIYEITNNLGVAILLLSIISACTFGLLIKYLSLKNQLIKNKYAKDVYLIKEKTKDPEKQLEEIQNLYKKDNYKLFLPAILSFIYTLINVALFSTIINYKKFIPNVESIPIQSFMDIKDIFAPGIYLWVPILSAFLMIFSQNIVNLKSIFSKQAIPMFATFIIMSIIFIIYGNIFGPLYLIYILGNYISNIFSSAIFFKYKKLSYEYNLEYQQWLKEKENK